jgi:alkylation response protein AidB-like acyl-CoA dehydrogenase
VQLEPTEEQRLIQRTAREFAERRLAPAAAARDRDGRFPVEELRELGQLGLLGVNVPEDLGGAAAGVIAYSLAMQELARVDASVAVAVSVTNMVAELIAAVGTPAQRTARVRGGQRRGAVPARSRCRSPRPAPIRRRCARWRPSVDGGWRLAAPSSGSPAAIAPACWWCGR